MRTVYIADDGTQFEDMYECEAHEAMGKHPELFDILLFNSKDERYQITKKNFNDDHIYEDAERICVMTDAEVACLQWFAEWHGYSEFEQITEPGVWIRTTPSDYLSDAIWVKIS